MTEMKRTFIPPSFRPHVKGEKLQPIDVANQAKTVEKEKKKSIVCLHVRDDHSQTKVIQQLPISSTLKFLCYDDLGIDWNFSFYKEKLTFYTENEEIETIGIYNRSFTPEYTHPKFYLYQNLMQAIESWKGPLIGAGMKHFQNSSKGFQLVTTIRKAIEQMQDNEFDFPHSYFVKGSKQYDCLSKKREELIVKSCSGIRSEAATYENFKLWDVKNLNSVPTLFQVACHGPDIRVHFLDGHCWPIILYEKTGSIDCRYAKRTRPFERLGTANNLIKFCKILSDIENLSLIGADFIKVNEKYYCLESNPSPGWAGFHRSSGEEPEIATTLINKLSTKI